MAEKIDKNNSQFQNTKGTITEVYTDTFDAFNRASRGTSRTYAAQTYANAAAFREALARADGDPTQLVNLSKKAYATNPIYASLINYYANLYSWRYTVIPHQINPNRQMTQAKFEKMYSQMLEIVEGLNLETIIPELLTQLFLQGSVFFMTLIDEESLTITTLIYPSKYARRVGQSQFGTGIIQIDMQYFDTLGFSTEQLNDLFDMFPKFVKKGYNAYRADGTKRWLSVDGAVGSCLMQNERGVPNLVYSFGSIINYELYGDNEVSRSTNKLRYIVTHKMPLYDGTPIFNPDEVKQLHSRLASVVNTTSDSKLLTTYGDINMLRVGESVAQEDKTLLNAYKSVFNNAGLNDIVFTGDSKEALVMSITRDKAIVWNYIQQLMTFYNISVNSYIDFKGYQADIEMLPVSPYSYEADMAIYRNNATLGVGKLQFVVASGMDQKHINDQLKLEEMLGLNNIKPLQSSYTGSSSSSDEETKSDTPETPAKEAPTDSPASEPEQVSDPSNDEDRPTVRPESEQE